MYDLDICLIVIVFDENKNNKFEIKSEKEIKIEEIKNKCKEKFEYSEEDLNNINLFFIDNDNDKNLITNKNDLISNAIEKSSSFYIELHAEVNKKQNNQILVKKNNNKVNNENNYINNDEKNNEKELIKKNKILTKKLKYYEERIRNLNSYYENLIDSLIKNKETPNKFNYENKNEEISTKDMLEINNNNNINNYNINNYNINEKLNKQNSDIIKNEETLKQMKENNDHLLNNLNTNQNEIINKKIKKNGNYIFKKLDFVNNKCNHCERTTLKINYKCILCDNYFICNNCYKKRKEFHEHNDFFEIKYPDEIIRQLQERINNNTSYNIIINKFNNLLRDIFFDKNGNLIIKEKYDFNKCNLNQICKELNSINESPITYFSEYKTTYLNQKQLEKFSKEDQKKIINNMASLANKLSEIEKDLKK